jgi:hypothetical protein
MGSLVSRLDPFSPSPMPLLFLPKFVYIDSLFRPVSAKPLQTAVFLVHLLNLEVLGDVVDKID